MKTIIMLVLLLNAVSFAHAGEGPDPVAGQAKGKTHVADACRQTGIQSVDPAAPCRDNPRAEQQGGKVEKLPGDGATPVSDYENGGYFGSATAP